MSSQRTPESLWERSKGPLAQSEHLITRGSTRVERQREHLITKRTPKVVSWDQHVPFGGLKWVPKDQNGSLKRPKMDFE